MPAALSLNHFPSHLTPPLDVHLSLGPTPALALFLGLDPALALPLSLAALALPWGLGPPFFFPGPALRRRSAPPAGPVFFHLAGH